MHRPGLSSEGNSVRDSIAISAPGSSSGVAVPQWRVGYHSEQPLETDRVFVRNKNSKEAYDV